MNPNPSSPPIRHPIAIVAGLLALALSLATPGPAQTAAVAKKIPVILTTDIGSDIDDTWALGFLLKSPELDLKLAVSDYGRPEYRAKLLAKFLERAGRGDVPVGLGVDTAYSPSPANQAAWVKDYDLAGYPGKVHQDGVQAMIDLIMQSPEPVVVMVLGPTPNIGAALEREPRIAGKARFVGMEGSVRIGYGGKPTPVAEHNVKADVPACQKAFTAPWEMTITPLDTCDRVQLAGEKYRRVRDSRDPVAVAIMENYRAWLAQKKGPDNPQAESRSTTLFDAVAVYLAFDQSLCTMETLGIRVTDDGFTVIDPAAKKMSVATSWKDLGAFEDLLVARLTGAK
jgi:inosine-uridine nucleoside N-ribohydrolase